MYSTHYLTSVLWSRLSGLLVIVLSLLSLNVDAKATTLTNNPPSAYIGGYVNSSKPLFVYDEIQFVGIGQDADGDTLGYLWDFGDGTTGVGEIVYHRYPKPGTYTIVLTVSDGSSQTSDQRALELLYQSIVSYPATPLGDTQIVRSAEVNYGGTDGIYVYNGYEPDYRALLNFDIGNRPVAPSDDAVYLGSFLELSCLDGNETSPKTQVFALLRSWVEGNGLASGNSGATWKTYNGTSTWLTPGGDYNNTTDFGYGANGVVAEAYVRDQGARVSYDLTALVDAWWAKTLPNYGILISMPSSIYYSGIEFASSEFTTDPTLQPTLSHKYIVGNFIRNAEATQNLQYWLKTSNTQADIVSEEDNKSFRITKSLPEGYLYQTIDLSNVVDIDSKTLQLNVSGQMRTEIENADSGLPFLNVRLYNKSGALLADASTPTANSTAWLRKSVSLLVPVGTSKAVIFLRRSISPRRDTNNPSTYFDLIDVSLSEIK